MSATSSAATPSPKQVVLSFYDALETITENPDKFVNLFAKDMRFWGGGTTKFSGEILGRDNFMAMLARLGEPIDGFITLKREKLIDGGDWIVTESQGSSTLKTGEPYSSRYVHFWRVVNGQIVELIEYFDTALVDRMFGPRT